MKKFLLLFLATVLLNSAFSQILFSEDFNYPTKVTGDTIAGTANNNSAAGDTTWKRHSGTAGTRAVKYNSNSLNYTGYTGSGIGGSVTFQHTVGSEDINGYIGSSISSGNVYAAFMLKIDSSGGKDTSTDYFFHFCDLYGVSLSNFRARIFACDGSAPNKFRLGLSKGTAAKLTAAQVSSGAKIIYTSSEYNTGQTYLVVAKYKFNTTSTKDDEISLFVIPAGIPTSEPTADISFSDTSFSDLSKIQSLCIRQGSIGRTAGTIDGFRVFSTWDAATAAALPIKLNSFNAIGLRDVVNLNWSAICSENSCNFIVERSTDGIAYTEVSSTNATSKGNYLTTDKNLPKVSTLYYRLKIVSANGKVEYSTVQRVQVRDVKLSVGPNPTTNEILINATSNITTVEVLGLDGKNYFRLQNNNSNSLRISTSNFSNGTYVVKTIIDGETISNKIVVKH